MIYIITIIALLLRLTLANQSLWLDEAASVEIARNLSAKISTDFHPPLFYLLLNAWLPIAGNSEWLLRLPNIIFGTLSVPALYFLVSSLKIKNLKFKIASISALILALNPLHIYYSQELRMYSLNVLLTILTWLFLVKKQNKLYILSSILNIYTFYGAFFNIIAQILYTRKIKLQIIIFLAFIPFLPIFFTQLQGGQYMTTNLPGWASISGALDFKSLALIPVKFSLGRISLDNKILYAAVSFFFSSYLILLAFLGSHRKNIGIFIFWVLIPLVIAVPASIFSPMLGYWRYIYLLPAFAALVAAGLVILPKKLFVINLIIITTAFIFFNLIFIFTPRFHREDWRSASKIISAPNSVILVNFPDVFAPLKFYAPDLKYYPVQESLGKNRLDLDQSLPQAIGNNQNIFVFDYLSDLTDPGRQVLSWLTNAGFKQKQVYNINGVGLIYQFATPLNESSH